MEYRVKKKPILEPTVTANKLPDSAKAVGGETRVKPSQIQAQEFEGSYGSDREGVSFPCC